MTKRLRAQDWINFALRTLAHEGFDAMKADVLARKLGVSRGSFYWHFSDLDGFHARVIEHWNSEAAPVGAKHGRTTISAAAAIHPSTTRMTSW
jgi:AcrR family transcriptional regulator